jgi:photosystem II stability/assembly factor-like uncharacterized protein
MFTRAFTKSFFFVAAVILVSGYSQLLSQNFWQLTGNTSTSFAIRPIVTNANGDIFLGTSSGTEGNGIFRSTDGGNSWTQSGLSNLFIWDILIDTSGNIFSATMGEGVWRSTDNGDSWTEVNIGFIPQDNNVNSLAINSNGEIYAGATNSIYVFSDSGDVWTPINSPNYNGFYPLEINADGDLYVGASGGRLFRSTDNGQNWTEITIAIALTGAITFNELGHVFAGNLLGIYRSTDKGDTWTQINNGINVVNYIAINAFTINSAKTIFVGLGGGPGSTSKGVFYSINNGDNWIELNDGLTNNALSSLTVDPDDYLYTGNAQGQVYKSTHSTTANSLIQKLSYLNLVLSDANPAISTINFSPPSPPNKISSVQGISSVQIVIDEATHQRTGDLTFTLEHLGVSQTIIFEVGGDGQDFISTILGDDNSIPIENGAAPFIGYYKPSNPLSVFSGLDPYGDWTLTITDGYSGNNGILNSWSLIVSLDGSTDVENENEKVPENFNLSQNYPNPFNPSTKIKYTIPSVTLSEVEGLKVALKIYDVLGNQVAIIVDEEQPAGVYSVNFDASQLASGMYLYRLQAGSFVQMKKMILIK